jgi:hypothetical protein
MSDQTKYQALFQEFNGKYFEGKLPRYKIEVCNECWGDGYASGECYRKRRLIWIARSDNANYMVSTLLHEMCHAAGHKYHGPRFFAEVQRIQALGAPLKELDPRDRVSQLTRLEVLDFVGDDDGGFTQAQIIRGLAREQAMSVTRFRRRYWWAPKVIQQAKRKAAEHRKAVAAVRARPEKGAKS